MELTVQEIAIINLEKDIQIVRLKQTVAQLSSELEALKAGENKKEE